MRQPLAQLVGVGRDPDVHVEAAFGEESLALRRKQRKILHALEHHDREIGGLRLQRRYQRGRDAGNGGKQRCEPFQMTHGRPPVTFLSLLEV